MVASRAQQVRAAARRRAVQAQEKRRAEEKAREKRCADLGVAVSVALAQRDEAVEHFEQQAGQALDELMGEGFTVDEAVRWSGVEGLSTKQAQRLRRMARGATRDQDAGTPARAVSSGDAGSDRGAHQGNGGG